LKAVQTAQTPVAPAVKPKSKAPLWAGLGVTVVVLAGAGGWFALRTPVATEKTPENGKEKNNEGKVVGTAGERERTLRYYVLFARALTEKKFGPPMRFSGLAAQVDSGNGVKLVLTAGEQGYLYVLNEGTEASAKPDLNIFFPSPLVRNGSAHVEKGEEINIPEAEGKYLKFDKQTGTEKTWIVYSAKEIPELDKLKKYATPEFGGIVKDQAEARAVPELMRKYPAEEEPKAGKEVTELRSKGDVLVHLIEWQHY